MVAIWRAVKVWDKRRPLIELPVIMVTVVATRKVPSRCEVVPATTVPATCQKMLEAKAPPLRMTRAPLSTRTLPATLKMKTSVAVPLMVMPVPAPVKETPVAHPCTPAVKVWPVMRPAMRLKFASGVTRLNASRYAACMLRTAIVYMAGVGAA